MISCEAIGAPLWNPDRDLELVGIGFPVAAEKRCFCSCLAVMLQGFLREPGSTKSLEEMAHSHCFPFEAVLESMVGLQKGILYGIPFLKPNTSREP